MTIDRRPAHESRGGRFLWRIARLSPRAEAATIRESPPLDQDAMAVFLFWNLNRRDLSEMIATLAHEHAADVVILAESETIPPTRILLALNSKGVEYRFHNSLSRRIRIFSRLPHTAIRGVSDSHGISIRQLHPPASIEILLVAVHLASKRELDDDDQGQLATRLPFYISEAEKQLGHSRTIVVGELI
jgi:hypothetical protein